MSTTVDVDKLDFAFQPIVSTHTGKIFAVEALIRNTHQLGFESIQDFFDDLNTKNTLFSTDIILREKAFAKFKDIDLKNLKLFYNIDNRIFTMPDFDITYTAKILNNLNLSHDSLCYELTEHYSFEDENLLVDIKELSYSQYGISLAKNNSYKERLKSYIKPVLEIDITWGIDKALEIFSMRNDAQGIFVTKDTKYYGFISLSNLLSLSYKRNIEIAQNQNPLTRLPGNNQIDDFITEIFKKKKLAHIVYFDFNDFKPFNDKYGFRQGDRAILMFSELMRKHIPMGNFIAHIGGDDFFVGFVDVKYEDVYKIIETIQIDFQTNVSSLYSKDDIKNNYITSYDRFGSKRDFKLLSVSAAIIEIHYNCDLESFNNQLGELKKLSKKTALPMGVCLSL